MKLWSKTVTDLSGRSINCLATNKYMVSYHVPQSDTPDDTNITFVVDPVIEIGKNLYGFDCPLAAIPTKIFDLDRDIMTVLNNSKYTRKYYWCDLHGADGNLNVCFDNGDILLCEQIANGVRQIQTIYTYELSKDKFEEEENSWVNVSIGTVRGKTISTSTTDRVVRFDHINSSWEEGEM